MKYRTPSEYKIMVKNMPVKELVGLADTFNESTTLTANEKVIQDILNGEVERRILNWEMTQV